MAEIESNISKLYEWDKKRKEKIAKMQNMKDKQIKKYTFPIIGYNDSLFSNIFIIINSFLIICSKLPSDIISSTKLNSLSFGLQFLI